MHMYQYIIPLIVIIALIYYFCTKQQTDYLKAFKKTQKDRNVEITLMIFSSPCDKSKFSMTGIEKNLETNQGMTFPSINHSDPDNYLTCKQKDKLIKGLLKQGYKEEPIKFDKTKFFNDMKCNN